MNPQISPTVSSPILHKSYPRSYTLYNLRTEIRSEEEGIREFTVTRRFSEFEWLHDNLTKTCPGILIPPLPKKEFFNRFDEQIVQSRIRGLEAFICRVTRHPLLFQQSFVKSFLEDPDIKVSYSNLKSLQEQTQPPQRGLSFWFETKVGEISISKQEIHISSSETSQTEEQLIPIRDSIEVSLDRINRVSQATTVLVASYSQYERLLENHCGACSSLQTFEDSQDPAPTTPSAMAQFAQTELHITAALNETIHAMRAEVEEPLVRLSQTTDEFSRTLSLQQQSHEQYLLKYTLLQKKISENKVKPQLEEDVRKSEESYQTISRNVIMEYDVYAMDKSRDLIAAVTSLANIQVRYLQQVSQELELLSSSLDRLVIESFPPVPTAPLMFPEGRGSDVGRVSSHYQHRYQPSSPPIAAVEPISYDPIVRTVNGTAVGHVVSGRFVDLSHSNSAELLNEHEYQHYNEEIIIGV